MANKMKCPECNKECELIKDDGHGYGDWYKCNEHGFVSYRHGCQICHKKTDKLYERDGYWVCLSCDGIEEKQWIEESFSQWVKDNV
jgi:hypothetical protein